MLVITGVTSHVLLPLLVTRWTGLQKPDGANGYTTPVKVAVILAVPAATAVANPVEFTVATAVLLQLQVERSVMSEGLSTPLQSV